MYIKDMFKKGKTVVSCEIFPPKKYDDVAKLYNTISELKPVVAPDFVSVTYGAGGSNRDLTVEIATYIKNKLNIEIMSHLTCVNSTKEQIESVLAELKENKIENILSLRGDPPQGQTNFTKTIGGFEYAYELTEFIKNTTNFCIGTACYPEGYPDARDIKTSVNYLKKKIDKGATFAVSQLFFDNKYFFEYMDMAIKNGVTIPIMPGIFPILSFGSIQKITTLSGNKISKELYDKLEKHQDDNNAIREIGIEHTSKQALELLESGIDGIHFYTMNKSSEISEIYNNVKHKIVRV